MGGKPLSLSVETGDESSGIRSGNSRNIKLLVLLSILSFLGILLQRLDEIDAIDSIPKDEKAFPDVTMLKIWNEKTPKFAATLSARHGENPLPTVNQPFVFFHLRKGGGQTLRSILYTSSVTHNLTNWIPCINPEHPCIPFSLPPNSINQRKEVYAGHVNYAHMTQLIRELRGAVAYTTTRTIPKRDGNPTNFTFHSMKDEDTLRRAFGTCLVNIRPTVDRVKSCWNYRMIDAAPRQWRLSPANNMTAEEWDVLLPDAIDKYGNGCNNEIARSFGNTQDENAVNSLSYKTEGQHFVNELETVLSRMAGCVMVRVDRCQDSNRILKHYLPWVKADLCQTKSNGGKASSKNKNDLAADVREVILSHNQFDNLAFDFGARLFEEQLLVAAAALNNNTDMTDLDRS